MFLRKVTNILITLLLIFILGNLSDVASLRYENTETVLADQPIQSSNFQSRLTIQFQFQAYTNIYSEFNVITENQSLNSPFQALFRFSNPLSSISMLMDNKELELQSIWAKNKIIQQLLPYHGFS